MNILGMMILIVTMIEIGNINKIDFIHNSMTIMIVVILIIKDNFNNKGNIFIMKMMLIIPEVI